MRIAAFNVSFPTSDPRETLRVFEPGFAAPKSFFDQLPFGHIEAGANKSHELAMSVTRHAGVHYPTIFAIGAPQPELYLESATGVKGRAAGAEAVVQIIGMHTADPTLAEFLSHGAAGEIQPCLVKERAKLVWARYPDHHRGHVGHIPKTLFALTQSRFGLLTFRDVMHSATAPSL
jgi:hypothetical protein